MRQYLYALFTCGLLLLLGACSGDDEEEDPIPGKCEERCKLTIPHPCYEGWVRNSKCFNDCRFDAGDAEKTHIKGCGLCVAETLTYYVNPNPPCSTTSTDTKCCWGILMKNPEDPECVAKCFEPDGGRVFW